MIDRFRRPLLLFLIFSIFVQTGLHFWPHFSFVSGVRVDYLSPTLYFSDVLIFLLIILQIPSFISHFRFKASSSLSPLLFYFILLLILPFFYAEHVLPHLMGVLQVFKYLFVGWVVSRYFDRSYLNYFLFLLVPVLLFQSLLSLVQFFFQQSVGSFVYLFGERMIEVSSIGAATFYFFGSEILRPYGTFPHPNVLAFFLFFCLVFLVLWLLSSPRIPYRWLVLFVICFGSAALFFTFSRVIIFCYLLFLFITLVGHGRKYWLGILFSIFILYAVIFFSRFSEASLSQDIAYRLELFLVSIRMVSDSYVFGMGINNFFYEQFLHHTRISPTFLQPVHNIYMLVVLHLGILGLGGFLVFVYRSLLLVFEKCRSGYFFPRAELIILTAILFVGIFDHFFLTLQQGQLMFAVLLGFVWSRV